MASSVVLVTAVGSGAVALWPATVAAQQTAAETTAQHTAGMVQSPGAVAHSNQWQQLGYAQESRTAAVARLTADRKRAATRAAHRAAARAAYLAAQQEAEQEAEQKAAAQPSPQPSQPSTQPSPQPAAPSGTPQQIAMAMLSSFGWSSSQFSCLEPLWNAESGWNVYAANPSSGAYGIPQALPGSKMASAGPDWQNDAATQIRWGLTYIQQTYGSPCGAWSHEESTGWY